MNESWREEEAVYNLKRLREAFKGSSKKLCVLCKHVDNTGIYFICKKNGYPCAGCRGNFENDLSGFNADMYDKLDVCHREGKYFEHYLG